jgi:hypothetical protein
MNSLRTKSNALHTHLIDNQLTRNSIWNNVDLDHLVMTFPKLSLTDIRTLTLGNSIRLMLYLHCFCFRSLSAKKSSKLCRGTCRFYWINRPKCRISNSTKYSGGCTEYHTNSISISTQKIMSILYVHSLQSESNNSLVLHMQRWSKSGRVLLTCRICNLVSFLWTFPTQNKQTVFIN